MQQQQITCSKISDDHLEDVNKLSLENVKCNESNSSLTNDKLQAQKDLKICEFKLKIKNFLNI